MNAKSGKFTASFVKMTSLIVFVTLAIATLSVFVWAGTSSEFNLLDHLTRG